MFGTKRHTCKATVAYIGVLDTLRQQHVQHMPVEVAATMQPGHNVLHVMHADDLLEHVLEVRDFGPPAEPPAANAHAANNHAVCEFDRNPSAGTL